MWNKLFPNRFSLLKSFILIFVLLSFIIRFVFLYKSIYETDNSFFTLINTFLIGLFFDIGTISFFSIPYVLYLLIVPKNLYGIVFDYRKKKRAFVHIIRAGSWVAGHAGVKNPVLFFTEFKLMREVSWIGNHIQYCFLVKIRIKDGELCGRIGVIWFRNVNQHC